MHAGRGAGFRLPPLPPTSADTVSTAWGIAQRLNDTSVALLQWQLEVGSPAVYNQQRVSFSVHQNREVRKSTRLLRAEQIRGPASAHYALAEEQAWFCEAFPNAVGHKHYLVSDSNHSVPAAVYAGSEKAATVSTSTAENISKSGEDGTGETGTSDPIEARPPLPSRMLERYSGYIRTYNADTQRGYIACDVSESQLMSVSIEEQKSLNNAEDSSFRQEKPELASREPTDGSAPLPDVMFYAGSVLTEPANSKPIAEGLLVKYSICDKTRQNKYVATLITGMDNEPFSDSNYQFATPAVRASRRPDRRSRATEETSGSREGRRGGRRNAMADPAPVKSTSNLLEERYVGDDDEEEDGLPPSGGASRKRMRGGDGLKGVPELDDTARLTAPFLNDPSGYHRSVGVNDNTGGGSSAHHKVHNTGGGGVSKTEVSGTGMDSRGQEEGTDDGFLLLLDDDDYGV